MFEFYGICVSPEICFGLGEGLSFNYWQENSTKVPIIVIQGRDNYTEQRICKAFNIDLKSHEEENSKIAETILIKRLINGYPVMVDVDRYYMPYLVERFGRSHFGKHALIVVGYKRSEKHFFIHDFTNPSVMRCPADILAEARASNWKPFSPNNRWYEFVITDKVTESNRDKILASITNVCSKMLSTEKFVGVNAIRLFSNDMQNYKNMLCKPTKNHLYEKIEGYIRLQMEFVARYINDMEPTGTLFRSIYASYLEQVSEIYRFNLLKNMSIQLNRIALSWKEIVEIIRDKNGFIQKIDSFINRLNYIATEEELFFQNLFQVTKEI